MDKIETVKIVKDNHAGYAIINKVDFDPKIHELAEAAAPQRPAIAPERAALVQEALALKVADKHGKPFPISILEKWAPTRLAEEIAKAKAKA